MSRAPKGFEVELVFTSQELSRFDDVKSYIDKFSKSNTMLLVPNYEKGSFRHFFESQNLQQLDSKLNATKLKQLANAPLIGANDLAEALGYGDIDFEYSQLMQNKSSLAKVYPGNVKLYSTNLPYVWMIAEGSLVNDSSHKHLLIDMSNPQSNDFAKQIYKIVTDDFDRNVSGMTNKGEALKVVSTVTYFTKEVGNIVPISEVYFNPAKREEEGNLPLDQTGRGKLYLAFVKKQYPNAIIKATNNNIIVKLN